MKNFMKEPIKKNEQIQEINKIEISLEYKNEEYFQDLFLKLNKHFLSEKKLQYGFDFNHHCSEEKNKSNINLNFLENNIIENNIIFSEPIFENIKKKKISSKFETKEKLNLNINKINSLNKNNNFKDSFTDDVLILSKNNLKNITGSLEFMCSEKNEK